jgi:hypothetical protein
MSAKKGRQMCGVTVHTFIKRAQGKGYNFTRREDHPCYL